MILVYVRSTFQEASGLQRVWAQAVLNRNLHSASGQRKLSPEEEYARHSLTKLPVFLLCVCRLWFGLRPRLQS